MLFFDTHAHYDWKDFDEDRIELFSDLMHKEINVVNIGINVESCIKVIDYAKQYENLYFALGVHPMEVAKTPFSNVEGIAKKETLNRKLVAIGETGLDYHFDYPIELQKHYFLKHIELANRLDLPIIIHARDSHNDVYNILKNNPVNKRGIMHCYSGNLELAKKFLELGYFLSFGGSITKSDRYDEIIKRVPLERIVIETDAPLMSPIEAGKDSRNDSRNLRYVINKIANLKEMDKEELSEILIKNAKKIYNI